MVGGDQKLDRRQRAKCQFSVGRKKCKRVPCPTTCWELNSGRPRRPGFSGSRCCLVSLSLDRRGAVAIPLDQTAQAYSLLFRLVLSLPNQALISPRLAPTEFSCLSTLCSASNIPPVETRPQPTSTTKHSAATPSPNPHFHRQYHNPRPSSNPTTRIKPSAHPSFPAPKLNQLHPTTQAQMPRPFCGSLVLVPTPSFTRLFVSQHHHHPPPPPPCKPRPAAAPHHNLAPVVD